MLSYGANFFILDEMLSSGASVVVLQSGATVVIWCRRVMLSSVMVAPPFFVFSESFTTAPVPKQDTSSPFTVLKSYSAEILHTWHQ
jgi:hypothetical protein